MEPSREADKLSYEIFSFLEAEFLFGSSLWLQADEKTQKIGEESPKLASAPRGKTCILSIDGGGKRGVIAAKALAALESEIRRKSGDPNARLADYFDLAAGSGIGGIFVSMLFTDGKDDGKPLFQVDDTWRLLIGQGKQLFTGKRTFFQRIMAGKHSPEAVFRRLFAGRTIKDAVKPILIPCYDLSTASPFVFSRADARESDGYDFQLSDICRATSAETAVFRPVSLHSVDRSTECLAVGGGLAINNPTAVAITHVLNNKKDFPFVRGVDDLLVLSIGAGDVGLGAGKMSNCRNLKRWTKSLVKIAGDGLSDVVDQAVSMAFGNCRSSNYLRIQANGLSHCDIEDNGGPNNVKKLLDIAEQTLMQKNVESRLFHNKEITGKSNAEKLEWFAGELIKEQESRKRRTSPVVSIKQATPRPSRS
ncbi:patatin-like protein 7 [Amborella trichopoda]|uniref:Patatin n=1 Tax=Amborella trichopoda TaxID=13333 RepID=W1NV97_AMBTC|nr:patatin-like protein 7 [Amborella trichopoda]ERM99233.1 hypothetical protein AMTR_s00092p00125490 [Amborella trichopoda]|eukprot:XP_006836380.1 patatin-like protein 7 [Amborella trichopoda]